MKPETQRMLRKSSVLWSWSASHTGVNGHLHREADDPPHISPETERGGIEGVPEILALVKGGGDEEGAEQGGEQEIEYHVYYIADFDVDVAGVVASVEDHPNEALARKRDDDVVATYRCTEGDCDNYRHRVSEYIVFSI